MTPLDELQHVLFGQLTHGNPTSDLECILDALRQAQALVWEEAAKVVENRVLNSSQSDRIPIFPLLDYFLDKAKEAQP